MQIDTAVAEADVGALKEGMKATFTVDAFPGKTFEGVVRQVRNSPTTTQGVVTYDAVIDVDNTDLVAAPRHDRERHVRARAGRERDQDPERRAAVQAVARSDDGARREVRRRPARSRQRRRGAAAAATRRRGAAAVQARRRADGSGRRRRPRRGRCGDGASGGGMRGPATASRCGSSSTASRRWCSSRPASPTARRRRCSRATSSPAIS